jgi:DMSO reductase anchor subunit
VAKAFLHYVHNQDMPEWENENTLAKYYITTTAVEMAKKGNK